MLCNPTFLPSAPFNVLLTIQLANIFLEDFDLQTSFLKRRLLDLFCKKDQAISLAGKTSFLLSLQSKKYFVLSYGAQKS